MVFKERTIMNNGKILWVDDEIDLLKGHIMFLENKGYDVTAVTNGSDAIEECGKHSFDLVMLDEMMPGLTGLETLQKLKEIHPQTPVVMVTKSEEENLMDQAIGSKIADYLIKPVNPHQILLSLKKNIHRKEIENEMAQMTYRTDYQKIADMIASCKDWNDWMNVYRTLTRWEVDFISMENGLSEMLAMQKEEADLEFAKYVKSFYMDWMHAISDRLNGKTENMEKPLMSPDVFKKNIFPLIDNGEKVFMIVIDNFRWDQWIMLAKEIGNEFDIQEDMYMSILPTATQYARNAIFSGLMPDNIAQIFPDLWVDEDEEEGKNLNEEPLIRTQIERFRRHDKFSYCKINDSEGVARLMRQFNTMNKNDLNVVVINFIDMLSHARTESKMVRELANNESAYRSITLSWLRHSMISDLFRLLAKSDYTIVLTTDHGSIRCSKPLKIIGDRNTNTNLRYKFGKNLAYNSKDVFAIKEPHKAFLPSPNVSTSYVFACGNNFFAYPNNYNYYVSYYKDTFQHGGISMEEMLVPLITMRPKKN